MIWNLSDGLSKAAMTYAGMVVLADVASAVGKGVAHAIESILPSDSSGTSQYNNPSHLGNKIDTRA